jgi:hypothetical protein
MKRLLITLCLIGAVAVPVVWTTGGTASGAGVIRHCGSFKFGTDGSQPGPSGITAMNVSCWFARATALLGAAPAWSCHLNVGLTFECRPHRGQGRVDFFGE